ncbi:MAG: SpoIIE family protein phosphatase [Ruminococcus sp.]|nr:SpoIIE family protein phosphatase [Ruminococcus sp.]
MKKTKPIFIKLLLIILPLTLAAEIIALLVIYALTYESTIDQYKKKVQLVSTEIASVFEGCDPSNPEDYSSFNWYLNSVCSMTDMAYIYCIVPNKEDNSIKYMSIGFGEDATTEARVTHYPGLVIKNAAHPEEFDAINGKLTDNIREEHNKYGDTLISYSPVTQHYDAATDSIVKGDITMVVGAEMSITEIVRTFRRTFIMIMVYLSLVSTLIVLGILAVVYKKVSLPAREISRRMSGYVTNRETEKREEKLSVKGNDEFALMAVSFNTMTEEIDRYIDHIDTLTRDKHTQEAELNIARRIQMGLLQPERKSDARLDLHAYILPAKDVGGDLYDYQILEDGRVFLAIADVSGKGISAALFMSRAVTLLHQFMLTETSPAKILAEYNDTLASQNPSGLFITTFLAVWDPVTEKLTYSNAGHNFPYILSDSLIRLQGAHGVAAGLFEGEEYENETVRLKAGDTFFLYTDGVNEAKNTEGKFYSTERLEEKLAACSKNAKADALQIILDDLNSFTQGADQNDDITMLSLNILPKSDRITLSLRSELSELTKIKEAILGLAIGGDMKKTLYLAAEEIFVNICSYAYDTPDEVEVGIDLTDRVELCFIDGGKPFDPTADVLNIDEYDHDHRIGGLGRFLVFSVADEYSYEYTDHKNILRLYFQQEEN